jgi:raffinose/stachyose/melibiose transport system substrate-binding protein
VQPIAADGKDGWNVTRWVSGYLFRTLGADALQKVADGKAKLTDADYVKAADAVAALGKAGAFGKGVASTDYNGAMNQFLTGKAAMLYMGSWALANFNDPKQNNIGADNVGFIPFPSVSGGAGSADELTANVGVPLMVASKGYNEGTAAWVKCIARNYGDTALDKFGVISGFKLHKEHKLPALTQLVQTKIASTKKTVLWFEALFSAKQTTVAQQNAGSLANGSISGADFMAKVQAAQ